MEVNKRSYKSVPQSEEEEKPSPAVYEDSFCCLKDGKLTIYNYYVLFAKKVIDVKDIISVKSAAQLGLSYWTDLKTNGMCLNNIWWALGPRFCFDTDEVLRTSMVIELKNSSFRSGLTVADPDAFLACFQKDD